MSEPTTTTTADRCMTRMRYHHQHQHHHPDPLAANLHPSGVCFFLCWSHVHKARRGVTRCGQKLSNIFASSRNRQSELKCVISTWLKRKIATANLHTAPTAIRFSILWLSVCLWSIGLKFRRRSFVRRRRRRRIADFGSFAQNVRRDPPPIARTQHKIVTRTNPTTTALTHLNNAVRHCVVGNAKTFRTTCIYDSAATIRIYKYEQVGAHGRREGDGEIPHARNDEFRTTDYSSRRKVAAIFRPHTHAHVQFLFGNNIKVVFGFETHASVHDSMLYLCARV